MPEDYYTSRDPEFLRSKQGDDAYWNERMRRQERLRREKRLQSMSPFQRKNNPNAEPTGAFTGRCPKCGSKDLWDDNAHWGCNKCGAFLG